MTRSTNGLITSAAFRQSCRLSATAGRALHDERGATASRKRIAREAFALALTDLVRWEDEHGVEPVAWVADQVTAARQLAQRAELLSAEDVCKIEREAVA